MPKLGLGDLLRRRKMTLKTFMTEHGLTTYGTLVNRCNHMGVAPPDEATFNVEFPLPIASDPQGGVVIVSDPDKGPLAIHEPEPVTGDPEVMDPHQELPTEPTVDTQKRPRKKKDVDQGE